MPTQNVMAWNFTATQNNNKEKDGITPSAQSTIQLQKTNDILRLGINLP